MRAMYAAERDKVQPRTGIDVGCPRGWAGAHVLRDTERLDRDLDQPARVPARAEAFQAETGPGERETVTTNER